MVREVFTLSGKKPNYSTWYLPFPSGSAAAASGKILPGVLQTLFASLPQRPVAEGKEKEDYEDCLFERTFIKCKYRPQSAHC